MTTGDQAPRPQRLAAARARARERLAPRAVGGWFRAAPRTRIGALAGVLALGASGLFGGLAPVDPLADIAPLTAEETVEAGPFALTLRGARTIGTLAPALSPADERNRLVGVVGIVENTSDLPVSTHLLTDAVHLEDAGIVRRSPPGVVFLLDSTTLGVLNPGLEYDVAILWEQRRAVRRDEVSVTIDGYTWREDSFTPGFLDWRDPAPVARGVLKVKHIPPLPEEEQP